MDLRPDFLSLKQDDIKATGWPVIGFLRENLAGRAGVDKCEYIHLLSSSLHSDMLCKTTFRFNLGLIHKLFLVILHKHGFPSGPCLLHHEAFKATCIPGKCKHLH